MRKCFHLAVILCCCILSVSAQNGNNPPPLDKSPMDMSYFPVNYPILKIQDKVTEPLIARILYSRPQKNNRIVFGELVEYGKIWRLGANEATEIELFRDVRIGSSRLKKGRYTMYAIPYENRWTIIFNKDTDTWGAFKYDARKDALRYDVSTIKQAGNSEVYTMFFEKVTGGALLNISWENVKASLLLSF